METQTAPAPLVIKPLRHVFPSWWISVPLEFEEDFIDQDRYWHAWDDRRSVSLTSIVVTDPAAGNRAVTRTELLAALPAPEGEPVELPSGLSGWAVVIEVVDSPRASRAVTGMIAVDGRILLATITSDDIAWAMEVWRSLEYAPTPIVTRPGMSRASRRAVRNDRHH